MLRAVALATVAVVGGMSTAPQGGQQSVQPVASPEAAVVGREIAALLTANVSA